MAREDWDLYFMKLAFMASSRATCPRRHVGAILVQGRSVKGTSYNGAPSGAPDCTEIGCLLRDGVCQRTIHAEANLILQTDHAERVGATVYCTDRPCWSCANLLANSGINTIVYSRAYHRDLQAVQDILVATQINLRHLPLSENIIKKMLGENGAHITAPS